MTPDTDRRLLVQTALQEMAVDALVCALPANILLVSGYWPVVGTSLAVVVRGGPTVLLVPEDEKEFAERGGVDEIHTYKPVPLDKLEPLIEVQLPHVTALAQKLGLQQKQLGYEQGGWYEASSYAAMHRYRGSIVSLLELAFQRPQLIAADESLMRQRGIKTPRELERLRLACRIAKTAFETATRQLRPGLKETEAAALFRPPLSIEGVGREGVQRADGYTFCMSGPNSATASGAFAHSRDRRLAEGDLVLMHCNSYVDGYWTDITRTYCLGEPDKKQRKMYDAVFDAHRAAREAIRVGARAADVDRAAREVLDAHGFGKAFKHSTGHGVGFSAINALARPRLHPKSPDVLETGMVFNVEPAIYLEGYGGIRHCDMIALTSQGIEELTPFQQNPSEPEA